MSRITDDRIEIEINEKKYFARLDLLALAEFQFYCKSRNSKMTIPQMFESIQDEDYFVICNLLVFCIKSCNPSLKMANIYEDLKFTKRREVTSALIDLINASMPKEDDKKKVEDETEDHQN